MIDPRAVLRAAAGSSASRGPAPVDLPDVRRRARRRLARARRRRTFLAAAAVLLPVVLTGGALLSASRPGGDVGSGLATALPVAPPTLVTEPPAVREPLLKVPPPPPAAEPAEPPRAPAPTAAAPSPPAPPSPAAARSPVAPPSHVVVELEAEDALLSGGMVREHSESAAAGAFVLVREADGNGPSDAQAELRFSLPRGDRYVLWARVRAPETGDNSFHLSVNDAAEQVWHVPGPLLESVARDWTWTRLAVLGDPAPVLLDLGPGEHRLRFRNREDGTQLDRVLLTTDLTTSPDDPQP